MLTRKQKEAQVADLKDRFTRAKGLVLTDYKGLTVAEITELRDSLRKAGIEYKVVKNTLARLAAEGTPAEPARDNFTGPVGVAIGYDDPAAVAKSILEFAKKQKDKFQVTCAVVDGTFCEPTKLKAIADLPSRDVLLGMMAGTMQAPAAKLARLLSSTVTQLGYALNALREKKAA
jgi:large subunit ribosomal protein L10